LSEPINALVNEKPAAPCSCEDLREQIADLEERMDRAELHLALRGQEPSRGLFLKYSES